MTLLSKAAIGLCLAVALAVSPSPSARADPIVTPDAALISAGLVASYPFNGNANDESGNGNNGTVLGPTLTADRYGVANSAYRFDGINDYIRIPDSSSLNLTGNFSISAWIRTTTVGRIVFSNMLETSPHNGYSFRVANSGAMYAISGDVLLTANTPITTGTWKHVAFTLTGTTGRIYVDGLLDKTGTSGVPTSFSGDQTIGASYTPFYFFNDGIDDVQVFNRALSGTEIAQLAAVPEPSSLCLLVVFAGLIRLPRSRLPSLKNTAEAQRERGQPFSFWRIGFPVCALAVLIISATARSAEIDGGTSWPAPLVAESNPAVPGLLVPPPNSVVGVVDTSDTFDDPDAFSIINNSGGSVTQAILRFTLAGRGNFDDNLPSQPNSAFKVNATSSPMAVTSSYADASTMPADFHGWRTLQLNFTGFDPGETLIFQADTDGAIGTTPPAYGAHSGNAMSGVLELIVSSTVGSGSAFYQVSGSAASTATVQIPEPGALAGAAMLGLALRRSTRRRRTASRVLPRRLLVTALVVIAAISVPSARAATFFSNQAAFQAAAGGGLSFESFEGLTATNVRSDRNSVAVAGFTLGSPNGNELSIFNLTDGGSHATNGSNYVLWGDFVPNPDTPTPNDQLVFNFPSPINAFSLILTDPLDLSPNLASIGFSNNLGESATIATAPAPDAAEVFFGVISSGMTSISIKTSGSYFSGDRLGIDSISFRVPEPASLVLLSGLAALTARRRRRA